MAFIFNPFTGTFDYYESGGGGGTSITVVANYSALPAAGTATGEFYWCSASQGTPWIGGLWGGTYYNKGMYYSNGVTWEFMDVPYQATQATVNTGTNDDQFVTPKTFTNASKWDTKKSTATGNAYKFETTDASGNLQETTVTASRAVATDANGLPTASATTATELGYLNGVTSAIQTQLDNRVVIVKKTTSDQTIVTGVTSNEITYSFLIPANTFAVGNIIDVVYRIIYTGTAGNKTTKTYINTSNTLTAATLLSTQTTGAASQVFVETERTIAIKSSTDSQTTNTTTNTIINLATSASAASSINIDWTVDQYFIVAIQLVNSGDSGVLSFLTMTKF